MRSTWMRAHRQALLTLRSTRLRLASARADRPGRDHRRASRTHRPVRGSRRSAAGVPETIRSPPGAPARTRKIGEPRREVGRRRAPAYRERDVLVKALPPISKAKEPYVLTIKHDAQGVFRRLDCLRLRCEFGEMIREDPTRIPFSKLLLRHDHLDDGWTPVVDNDQFPLFEPRSRSGWKKSSQSPNSGISNQFALTSTSRNSRVSTVSGSPKPFFVTRSSFA